MKAIEKSAREFVKNEKVSKVETFIAGVEFAQKWIPIEEYLPTEQGHYFVKCKSSFPKNCNVVVAEFYEDNETFYSESSDYPFTMLPTGDQLNTNNN